MDLRPLRKKRHKAPHVFRPQPPAPVVARRRLGGLSVRREGRHFHLREKRRWGGRGGALDNRAGWSVTHSGIVVEGRPLPFLFAGECQRRGAVAAFHERWSGRAVRRHSLERTAQFGVFTRREMDRLHGTRGGSPGLRATGAADRRSLSDLRPERHGPSPVLVSKRQGTLLLRDGRRHRGVFVDVNERGRDVGPARAGPGARF